MTQQLPGQTSRSGLRVEVCPDYDALSNEAVKIVVRELRAKPNLLLCAATGASPTGLYAALAEEYRKRPQWFDQLRVVKLDEWGGLSMDDPATCEVYLQQQVVQPLRIPSDRYVSFDSNADDPRAECGRIQNALDAQGPIDICILGIGLNGHLALNEPAEYLYARPHIAELAPQSREHSMLKHAKGAVSYGLTLGMSDIMLSRKIILLVSGAGKQAALSTLLRPQVTTQFPASLLHLHPDATILCDRQAASADV